MYRGERLNAATHFAGMLLAVAGAAWLWRRVDDASIAVAAGCIVYGVALVLVYFTSTVYHCARGPAKQWWERADHCAIYLLIAGTYTALAVPVLHGTLLAALLVGVWALAVTGIVREARTSEVSTPSVKRYIATGWVGIVALGPVMSAMPATAIAALVGGALLYTAGTWFYVRTGRMAHAHGVWHSFTVVASACHYFAIMALLR
jgi:hemolysin III